MRQFQVFRGGVNIGSITVDGRGEGGQWQPIPSFEAVRALFERESSIGKLLEEASKPEDEERYHEELEGITEEIMEPGIECHANDGSPPFELLSLSIDGERAFWR